MFLNLKLLCLVKLSINFNVCLLFFLNGVFILFGLKVVNLELIFNNFWVFLINWFLYFRVNVLKFIDIYYYFFVKYFIIYIKKILLNRVFLFNIFIICFFKIFVIIYIIF